MEIPTGLVLKIMQRVADAADDSTADHVLMALERVQPEYTADEVWQSVLESVADGLGVPLV